MTAVRKIEISDNNGVPKFRFDSTGLPEQPVIMHQCASCLADSVITNKDAGDLAAWLIGEAVDDAHGEGRADWSPSVYIADPGGNVTCDTAGCADRGMRVDLNSHLHRKGGVETGSGPARPWAPSGPDDEAGSGTWPHRHEWRDAGPDTPAGAQVCDGCGGTRILR